MTDARAVAEVAHLLGDRSRAAMCLAMLDGGRWTVTELAAEAAVGKAAASEHVTRLAAGGLVATEREGRCTYVSLAGPHVAELLEALATLGEPAPVRSLNAARSRERLAAARTCYDHLAGRLGVAVYDAMLDRRLLHRRGGIGVTAR
ncbi:MAG: helix-turn-helix transcriptional regulator, partial [Nocardioidaceae bacterium]|nr:helix-turn-helix transcriptional regulator [Nocardioidaceae bacterium]